MYRMAIITMLAPTTLRTKLDLQRCTRMALVHDMAEAIVGDITPADNVSKADKNHREASSIDFITGKLLGWSGEGGMEDGSKEIRALWQEYEDSLTPEAIFVHDVDKFELVLQMFEYEKREGGQKDLGEFFYVANKIQTKEVLEWCQGVLQERKAFWGDTYQDRKGVRDGENLETKLKSLQ
jgi:putative hydrolases of HD superfamily